MRLSPLWSFRLLWVASMAYDFPVSSIFVSSSLLTVMTSTTFGSGVLALTMTQKSTKKVEKEKTQKKIPKSQKSQKK